MHPFVWKPRAKQQFSASRAILRSSRTVAGQFRIRSDMHPLDWKPRVRQQSSAGQAILCSSRTIVAKRQPFKPNRARLAGQHKRFQVAGCAVAGCTAYQEQKKQHSGIKENQHSEKQT